MAKGQFHWFELVTDKADNAKEFYTSILGWGTQSADMPEGPYVMFTVGDKPIAGFQKPPSSDVPQHWLGYIHHDDVDAGVAFVAEQGGQVLAQPFDVPTVGRMAICLDPWGAVFALFNPENDTDLAESAIGDFCWFEHYSPDVTAARSFYERLFGWTHAQTMKMPEGDYAVYNIGSQSMIGFMQGSEGPPHWNYYVKVADAAKTKDAVEASGGNLIHGPMEIEGGVIAVLQDPDGGVFSVFSDAN